MAESKLEGYLMDENNMNDIFERKIEIGAVIQFNFLQKLIEEFIKRQKLINDKVNNLELKINSLNFVPKNSGISELDMQKDFDELNIDNIDIKNEKNIQISNKGNNESQNNNKIEGNKNIIYNEQNNIENKYEIVKNNNENKENEKINNKEIVEKNNDGIDGINNMGVDKNNYNIEEFKKIKEQKMEGFINNEIPYTPLPNYKYNETPSSPSPNNNYRKVNSRLDKLELYLKELNKRIVNTNIDEKADIDQIKSDLSEMKKNDNKIKIMEKTIIKMNEALKEYNILDYFKKDNNEKKESKNDNENEPSTKVLIKKIEITENKTKEVEEDVSKVKKGLSDINDKISTDKNNYNDFAKEVSGNFNEMKFKNINDINYLSNLIFKNIQDLKDEFTQAISQVNKKMKDVVIEEIERNKNSLSNNASNSYISLAKINNEKINNINSELKNYINKSLSDTEKYLKSYINNLGIDKLRQDIVDLSHELDYKLIKTDLDYIDIKLNEFETKFNQQNLQMEKMKKDVNICNESCSNSVKRIEYLSGQVAQGSQIDLEQVQREEIAKKLNSLNPEKLQSIITKNDFDKEVNNLYKKIEQTLEVESENYKFIQHIEGRLKFFVTENELKSMEECLMNSIDDLKNEFSKKYMEKTEIMKNLKILELQIKNIYEGNLNVVHSKEGDNWLLAKKPINNYLCASCESYIGDLKNNKMYLPWNKIPSHEGQKYRMGNGFSRMLQLINTDLMKSAERLGKNLTIKIDDKKTNQEIIRQLPRIGSQISMRHSNYPNNTFSLNQENLENKFNNSADEIENLDNINSNNMMNNSNIIQEKDEKEKNVKNIGGSSSRNNYKQNPKVIKIIKKNKNDKKE